MPPKPSNGNTGCSDRDYELCEHRRNLQEQRAQLKATIRGLEQQNKMYREYIDKLEKENEIYFQKEVKRLELMK